METRAALVADGSTVLRFVREGLVDGLRDAFDGPVGLTPDALEAGEVGVARPRCRVLRALARERTSGRLGPVGPFVHAEGSGWVSVPYEEREAGMAAALRSPEMNGLEVVTAGRYRERPPQWLSAGCAEALAVAHFHRLPLLTCCELTRRVASQLSPAVQLFDGHAILQWVLRRRRAS